MSKLRINKTHFKPECYYSLIFAELSGLRPLNPHQSSARGDFPRPPAEADLLKFLLDATVGSSKQNALFHVPNCTQRARLSPQCLEYALDIY